MSEKALDKLKKLLEGKTVIAVDPPNAREAICRLTLSDGTAFRLHATDLGFWTEATAASDGRYHSLNALAIDYGNHHYELEPQYDFDTPHPKIAVDGDVFHVEAPDGRVFEGNLTSFTEWEQEVGEVSAADHA